MFALSLFLLSAAPATEPAAPECRAAVLDLQHGPGVTADRAQALSEIVTSEVGAHLDCSVVSRREIQALMDFEAQRQMAGCDSESCLSEIGAALGVSRLVLGTMQVVDGKTLVSLRLVDMHDMRVLRRVTDATRHGDSLLPFVGWLTRRLILGDDAAGPRPVDDTRVLERQMTLWRGLSLTSLALAGGAGVLGGAAGVGYFALEQATPQMKVARGANRAQIEGAESYGPWLAGGANLGLYLSVGLAVVGGALFFLPGDELVETGP